MRSAPSLAPACSHVVRHLRVTGISHRCPAVAVELSDELIELERAAWAEQQGGRLAVEAEARARVVIISHTEATGQSRCEIEAALK